MWSKSQRSWGCSHGRANVGSTFHPHPELYWGGLRLKRGWESADLRKDFLWRNCGDLGLWITWPALPCVSGAPWSSWGWKRGRAWCVGEKEGSWGGVPPPNLCLWSFSTASRVWGISDFDVFSKSQDPCIWGKAAHGQILNWEICYTLKTQNHNFKYKNIKRNECFNHNLFIDYMLKLYYLE